jgi:hypothetical protein
MAMVIKELILKKILSNGMVAEFLLVNRDGEFEAALYVGGRYIGGPSLPQELSPPKGEITHWMGNKPSVGLTQSEAERIIATVEAEKSAQTHRQRQGW